MSALTGADDDRPAGEQEEQRRLLFWEQALFMGRRKCGICEELMSDWVDALGVVWRMCCVCDVDVANPPKVRAQ